MKRPKLVLTVQSVLSRDGNKSLTFVVLLNLLELQDSKVNTHIRIRPKLPSPPTHSTSLDFSSFPFALFELSHLHPSRL